jgi:sugar-specific transcriptional regulator TrmB
MLKEAELYIETLMKLGLTQVQATVYLTNAQLGKADVTRISKLSNIARSDVYRVIPALEKKGLLEKTLGTPIMYKAVPLKGGLLTLLEQKSEENDLLKIQTNELLRKIQDSEIEVKPELEESEFIITSELNLFSKHFEAQIKAGSVKEEFIATAPVFKKLLINEYENFRSLLERGVKIWVLTEKGIREDPSVRSKIKELKKNRLFRLKYVNEVPVCLAIIDNKAVNCQISTDLLPNLWSNNPQMLKIFSGYFELQWNKTR